MKVLVACEFSGTVRDAFRARGHDAWSCDLEGVEVEGEYANYHLEGDCRWFFENTYKGTSGAYWDLMIAHPPCTFLANSGVRWLYKGGAGSVQNRERWQQMHRACRFFRTLLAAPIHRIAVENPIPHKHAALKKYTQIIHPWQFGHNETKATCLWLKNLPPLKPTKIVDGRVPRVHYASPGPDRWKERSRTLRGIAEAMAEQWGTL